MNYFELFTLPKKFRINKDLLNKNFYKLQLKFHPDLFINQSESKKKWVLKKSIEINKGYKILNSSLNRSMYLLFLNGVKVDSEKLLSENQCFLKKYFFLYEELELLKKKYHSNTIHFNTFIKKIENEIKDCENIIDFEFHNKNWNKIIHSVSQLLFLKKIKKKLKT
ncbi:Fe-S protein assembly co-chaperone HscB [Buchnera aphidicola (Aphis nasturtii)]|uniref:Fe-S protein assembly co-chaperone HscB n=1 Tax=Buchnera aphidicola TaxID=9 RepID=UPI0010C52F4A|nr:Fe-S protein assembly co-chaperone HscB [Buchnera aphidicola]QCI18544.1 Fe-S protein assembly co-chaperone HscB [Buchnera aphidicola (Aphis nasturtii)]